MPGLIIVKTLLVRAFLVVHGLICAWRVVETSNNSYAWVILVGLGFLCAETVVLIGYRHGREYPNIAFCIIFYLTCTAPSLWILHVDTANEKLYRLAEEKLNVSDHSSTFHSVLRTSTPLILSIQNIDCHDEAWHYVDEQRWLDAIQETMFVILVVVRCLISFEYFTVEQSSIIFALTFLSTADLLAISNALQYHDVIIDRFWMYIGLVLLTIGLFQLSFIDTDGFIWTKESRTRRVQQKFNKRQNNLLNDNYLGPLIRSLFIHDGLLLVYRIFLLIQVRCNKPSIIFFISKNALMMAFHLHRVYFFNREKKFENSFNETLSEVSTDSITSGGRYQFYGFQQEQRRRRRRRPFRIRTPISGRTERLLHRTIRHQPEMIRRRILKSPSTFYQSSTLSITYPFACRRHDGGRTRTAFAFYGLPFPTPQIARPTSVASRSSHLAKTFIF